MEIVQSIKKGLGPIPILDSSIPVSQYCPINLSKDNRELNSVNVSDARECQDYVDVVLKRNGGRVAYGGYLEKRNLYGDSERFKGKEPRDIHLGMDFWCTSGTKVLAPLNGVVHSFANNSDFGNYGPTVILRHQIKGDSFYTLYGHLSLESLGGLYMGKVIEKGEPFVSLGTPDINVGYAPHLHFQLVLDLDNYQGDYPGVCSKKDLVYFRKNCPDPNLLLGYPF
ncbi:peptidoglycan DD-metalloendopeptidase family protein [Muricauda sp. SCSIO 64092]|uniref:peptidoglycan DD-metalloendopeptidase family protein n=1 Tax=Allomuricauda sp. SCSIO 64092 TaxID=2908842 RepID=UPI001FF42D45|nr:peptidoglycan DD-metalloendopeptidase family protein [Muricauda sp. SCSIO 64092]UOY05958.1 peptidoglycan DD-metalloendopeptidase family protein [Muricauda sp. SCSIO 64092]